MKKQRFDYAEKWPGLLALGLALFAYGWAAQRGWDHSPTDAHSARQAQTAMTAEMMHATGFSNLTPFNGLGPPWDVPMEFPTYQLLTAGGANLTGGNIVAAGRLVALLGTLVLIPALWLLLRQAELDFNARAFGIALLLVCPLWMHFSRSILIESWATALATWWLAALIEALHKRDREWKWICSTAIVGVLAALTKVTSFVVVLPAGCLITAIMSRGRDRMIWYRSALATLPALMAAVTWTWFADQTKIDHPLAGFLTSENLRSWNWGTWEQRWSADWWTRGWDHLQLLFPPAWWGLVLLAWWWGTPRQRLGIALAIIAFATGPLAFANLYYVHNYYFMAVVPAGVVALAIGFGILWKRISPRKWWQAGAVGLLAGLGWMQVDAYRWGLGGEQVRHQPLPEFGLLLHEITQPGDHVVVFGSEWNPLLAYTLGRPVAFIRETYETDEDAWQLSRQALAPDVYTVLVATNSVAGDLAFVKHRCQELGLQTQPLLSTAAADIYVSESRAQQLQPSIESLGQQNRILETRPDRMGPGESRIEFLVADWHDLPIEEAKQSFPQCRPYPDQVFTKYDAAQLEADGQPVLHIHPPGGLRFTGLPRDRSLSFEYGLRPEIWRNRHDSDGVRFRFYARGSDGRQRLLWSDFVQPLTISEDQQLLNVELPLESDHELELWIDAGPDHNPGYDWAIIADLRIE